MSDITERLREASFALSWAADDAQRKEAADEILRLRAEIEAMRLKLKRCGGENCMGWRASGVTQWVTADSVEALRAALQEADTIMCHDDAATEWREKWARLWGKG